ncbi:Uncharacterised protein [Klebsiella pneumoniae]|nr:hypothetical protein UUU_25660 [Klebsiella pneumoniae subsp. pneumoniae DSM 30104 = JCM 1662 = NBRC 14940]SVT13406.1 Uncharacterised protein [Klebsiella pneumoniae]SWH44838.1 Uncharacterised protein [Klebsiella pneumoniae]SWH94231.1 Uncharacterised protein [Klebsiella pneumoniae]SWI06881.1 Uncharacterised protein [Klebsiella pneumoniae]
MVLYFMIQYQRHLLLLKTVKNLLINTSAIVIPKQESILMV